MPDLESRQTLPTARTWISEAAANSLTHALGLLLALVGAPLLVAFAFRHGTNATVSACIVYGLSLILLYAASTHYHLFQHLKQDGWQLIADHVCIYLLIAGTYTPFCFTVLRGPWGLGLFIAIWSLAAVGIAFKLIFGMRYERLSLAFYIIMGWLAAISLSTLIKNASATALILLFTGGAAYTIGTLFYARVWVGQIRYSHAVWHLAVVAGSTLHYFSVRACILSVPHA